MRENGIPEPSCVWVLGRQRDEFSVRKQEPEGWYATCYMRLCRSVGFGQLVWMEQKFYPTP